MMKIFDSGWTELKNSIPSLEYNTVILIILLRAGLKVLGCN